LNPYRRKILKAQEGVLDDINGEIEILAVGEAEGDKESKDSHVNRVKGWQSRLEDVEQEIESVKDEESDAQENTKSEDRKDTMQSAIDEMEECINDLQELISAEEPETFNEFWHSKYDSMITNLQNAAE
jgi:CHASE3 domain sensor protein